MFVFAAGDAVQQGSLETGRRVVQDFREDRERPTTPGGVYERFCRTCESVFSPHVHTPCLCVRPLPRVATAAVAFLTPEVGVVMLASPSVLVQ